MSSSENFSRVSIDQTKRGRETRVAVSIHATIIFLWQQSSVTKIRVNQGAVKVNGTNFLAVREMVDDDKLGKLNATQSQGY